MNRATKVIFLSCALGLLVSCGGSGASTSTQTSKIKTRAFVTNSYAGTIDLIDYSKNILYSGFIFVETNPQSMVLTPDGTKTLVNNVGGPSVSVIDNKTESSITSLKLPAAASSIVVTPDSKLAYAATRNAEVSGAQTGAVQILDLVNNLVYGQIPVPLAQSLALSPDGKKLLVFSDGADKVSFVDLTSLTASTPSIPVPVNVNDAAGTMSRPVTGIFSSDGSKAYVTDCGVECGAEAIPEDAAGVTVIDMSTSPPTSGAKFSVAGMGASTMLLDGSTLYVAGTIPGQTAGSLTVLTVNGSTLSVAKDPVKISLGLHNKMIKGADNTLFIGATGCPNVVTVTDPNAGIIGGGCLSIYDTSSAGVTITNDASGFVTGMAAVPGQNVVYVVEGGELHIYNTKTKAILQPPCLNDRCFMDVVGRGEDVLVIDK